MELTGFLPTLRRWWWLLVAVTLIAGWAGYAVASRITPTYEAEVRMLVGPVNTDRETLLAAGQLAQTYAELATSQALIDETIDELGLQVRPERLRTLIDATANDVTRMVAIRARSGHPQIAADTANTLARRLTERTSGTPARPAGALSVIDPARPPLAPVEPQIPVLVALATLAGSIAGLVLLIGFDRLREVVASEDDLTQLTDSAVLVVAPRPALLGTRGRALTVVEHPGSDRAASYRLLASRVSLVAAQEPMRSVAVLGSSRDDGSSEIAANLAAALAATGEDVTILDLNHRSGAATRLLGLAPRPGIADAIGTAEVTLELVQLQESVWLNVLPSDPDALESTMTLERARRLLAQLEEEGDVVVVHAAPLQRSADSMIWARAVDGVILCVQQEGARRRDVAGSADGLRSVGARLVGTVMRSRRRPVTEWLFEGRRDRRHRPHGSWPDEVAVPSGHEEKPVEASPGEVEAAPGDEADPTGTRVHW